MRVLLLAVLTTICSLPAAAQGTPTPCAGPEHRQFDFWLGDWNVHGTDGTLAGTNSIVREMGGCVLHERYQTPRGYTGESFNVYDVSRKVWHQTWVDSSGLLLVLEGGLSEGQMVLEGTSVGRDGTAVRQRITWTPNADGSVRQLWEATGEDGTRRVVFDGTYTRR